MQACSHEAIPSNTYIFPPPRGVAAARRSSTRALLQLQFAALDDIGDGFGIEGAGGVREKRAWEVARCTVDDDDGPVDVGSCFGEQEDGGIGNVVLSKGVGYGGNSRRRALDLSVRMFGGRDLRRNATT